MQFSPVEVADAPATPREESTAASGEEGAAAPARGWLGSWGGARKTSSSSGSLGGSAAAGDGPAGVAPGLSPTRGSGSTGI
jgi:hypothetical protein